MASRYDQREIVIQALFESDFNDNLDTILTEEILKRDAHEFLLLESVPDFALDLAKGIILKKEVIDEIIEKAAPEWPIHKISLIDRALLRLGIFELIFGSEMNIPPKVAINEAIELAKAFGGDTSRKFVNGVLGGIYKEMVDNDPTIKVEAKKEIVIENLVGAMVYKKESDVYKVAFISDLFKHFTLPKGHMKEGKNEKLSLIEIVKNEINVDVIPEDKIGENIYTADAKGKIIKKKVVYFTAKIDIEEDFAPSESILDLKWFSREELENVKLYKDMKEIIVKGFDMIEKNIKI